MSSNLIILIYMIKIKYKIVCELMQVLSLKILYFKEYVSEYIIE
jgi:hypothetical protein